MPPYCASILFSAPTYAIIANNVNVNCCQQVVPIDRLDFEAMVQESEEGITHLRFLVEILLASAIQCEDKETYIRKIMTELGHEAQVRVRVPGPGLESGLGLGLGLVLR